MNAESIRRVAVVGVGLMGHGIAQEFALGGYEVRINDLSEAKLQGALENIEKNLRTLEELGLVTRDQAAPVAGRIHPSLSLEDTVSDADYVAEAMYEDLPLKQRVFADLDRLCPEHTILASNTSTLMPTALAASTARPDRVLVAHYINPPHLIPIVEVVRGAETSDQTVETTSDLLSKLGKRPIVLKREVPGFVVNRLQIALLREAVSIVEKGVASAQDVDAVVRGSFGRRLAAAGPFEVFELGGWDTILAVASQLVPEIDSSPEVPALLRDMVARGDLGTKTGKGVYEWTPESAAALKDRVGRALVAAERLSAGV